jgi:tRNA U34 5-carboxymethylaminomethyl modifying GTPase MnmE/TrmE
MSLAIFSLPIIRPYLHYFGKITGEINTEEQPSWVFGKFCIGK